jgi:hypothetical protein
MTSKVCIFVLLVTLDIQKHRPIMQLQYTIYVRSRFIDVPNLTCQSPTNPLKAEINFHYIVYKDSVRSSQQGERASIERHSADVAQVNNTDTLFAVMNLRVP